MIASSSPSIGEDVPSLPDEQVEFVLDARAGLVDEAAPGSDALIVTNRRVARVGSGQGSRVLTLLPLSNVSAVEALDAGRSLERLGQGILFLALGLALGGGSWVVLGVQVLSVLLGGLPALAGVYALAGWAFPDTEGQLRIHTFGQVVTQPLRSSAARRDAYAAATRLSALAWSEMLAGAVKLIEAATDGVAAVSESVPSAGEAEDADPSEEDDAQAAADGVATETDHVSESVPSVGEAEDADPSEEDDAQAATDGVAAETDQGPLTASSAGESEGSDPLQEDDDGVSADGVAAETARSEVISSDDAGRADSIWERIRGSSARY